MSITPYKVEFDLTIKKFRSKNHDLDMYEVLEDERKAKWEEYEKSNFKSLSAKEVLRKLIDYLT